MNYNEIKHRLEDIRLELNILEKECVTNNKSWEEYVKTTRPLKEEEFKLDKEIRLLVSPNFTTGKKWDGVIMSLDDFKRQSIEELLTDTSGIGYYYNSIGKSDIRIYPSDVTFDKVRTDIDSVLWIAN